MTKCSSIDWAVPVEIDTPYEEEPTKEATKWPIIVVGPFQLNSIPPMKNAISASKTLCTSFIEAIVQASQMTYSIVDQIGLSQLDFIHPLKKKVYHPPTQEVWVVNPLPTAVGKPTWE